MALTVHLPQHIRDYIARQVAEGRFESEDAVIANAVEQAMEDTWRWDEDEELLAAIAEADRGEGHRLTPELMADIRRESEESLRNGHQVRDDIKY